MAYLSAFLLGLWGSLHCVAMCGGIASLLQRGIDDANHSNLWRYAIQLGYNLGRITSYAIAGALAALLSTTLIGVLGGATSMRIMQSLSGLFLIAFGLSVGNWWNGIAAFERLGGRLWKRIAPLTKRVLPIRTPLSAYLAGMVWGWLPCGFVYTALAWTLTLDAPLKGFFFMLSFGAGTIPMMLIIGSLADGVATWLRNRHVRTIIATVLILSGVATFLGLLSHH